MSWNQDSVLPGVRLTEPRTTFLVYSSTDCGDDHSEWRGRRQGLFRDRDENNMHGYHRGVQQRQKAGMQRQARRGVGPQHRLPIAVRCDTCFSDRQCMHF